MTQSQTEPADAPQPAKTVAAIDIGSNALRMVIAEVLPDGRINVLERLQRAVRLGQDAFRRGRLGAGAMQAAVAVLRDYRQMLRLYQVERVRAVATSAIREAGNADTFLDRIFMTSDLNVEVIDTSEESRLAVSAVRNAADDAEDLHRHRTVVVEAGGGSTLLTVLHDGEIATGHSLPLGSIRLQEVLATSDEPPERSAELLHQYIVNETSTLQNTLPLEDVRSLVALGSDARFAARKIGKPTASADLVAIPQDLFDKLVRECQRHTPEELAKRHNLPFAEAETLVPALLIYQVLLQKTQAKVMLVSHVSIRDGLLLELAREVTGQEDKALLNGVVHSATAIAAKYRTDLDHARTVAELSVCLFEQLQAEHGLRPRDGLLLRVAALLHEIGGVVSNRAHHKHSYYLIANAEIFGLTRDEITIVAHVARYHRRGVPKPSHVEYMMLPRKTRVVINKLAALLRMADALARGHLPSAAELGFRRDGDELIISMAGGADLLLEQRAIATKGDLFEDIYGLKVRLEQV